MWVAGCWLTSNRHSLARAIMGRRVSGESYLSESLLIKPHLPGENELEGWALNSNLPEDLAMP